MNLALTTGRKRRCGWFDAALLRQTCATSGITGICLTKLDVLDGFETLKICVGYDLDGERLDYLPTAADAQASIKVNNIYFIKRIYAKIKNSILNLRKAEKS